MKNKTKFHIILTVVTILILSMTCTSFADSVTEECTKTDCNFSEIAFTDSESEMRTAILISGDEAAPVIVPMFDGNLKLPSDITPSSIATYQGYFKVHSWKGSNITFGVGITCSHSILTSYHADIEIWDANLLNHKLLSSATIDIPSIGTTKTLVNDKTMYTGSSVKEVLIRVKNIKVTTTAGPISREAVSGTFKRP